MKTVKELLNDIYMRRNALLYDTQELKGQWVAVPSEDWKRYSEALRELREVIGT